MTPPGAPVIAPFSGVRYNLNRVSLSRVVAPPYDVISESLQAELYARDPFNAVRLILGRQLPQDNEKDNRYTRAASDLQAWIDQGILQKDPEPCYTLYEQEFEIQGKKFKRRGFLALRRLEEFQGGKIRPHEKTLSGPKADRLLLLKACRANLSPIFALHSDPDRSIFSLLDQHTLKTPLADFTDKEGVRQRLWKVSDRAFFQKVNEVLGGKNLFIADGHHRYETSLTYRNWLREQRGSLAENSQAHYVMMFLADMADPGMIILPTHRILKNWLRFNPEDFKKALAKYFQIVSFLESQRPQFLAELHRYEEKGHALGLLLGQDPSHYVLVLKEKIVDSKGLELIDTALLHQMILREILGMTDENERDPKFLRFVKEENQVFDARSEPAFHCGFLLNAPRMDELCRVVESGQILPPKTTFFYPKLLSGLVINQIDADGCVAL